MDADVIKQFVKIIRYADKDTLNAILQLIDISKPLSLLECEDASLKLLNLLLTKKDNKKRQPTDGIGCFFYVKNYVYNKLSNAVN